MKKLLLVICLFVLSIGNIYAASLTVTIDCPVAKASASANVNCDIYATPKDFTLTGIQVNYNFTNSFYSNFVASNGFVIQSSSSTAAKGFIVGKSSGITEKTKIGVLTLTMPLSGIARVELTNIIGSDSEYRNVPTSNTNDQVRTISTDNTLSSLTVSDGSLSPSFSPSVTSYTVSTNLSSIRLSATTNNSYASVTGTGNKELSYGKNTFRIVVTSESGEEKEYKIEVTRNDTREDVNTLKSLSVSDDCVLDPEFSSNTNTYKCSVESTISKVTISSTKTSSKSSYVSGFGPREVKLSYGKNEVQIKIKSEQGNVKVYTINIERKDGRSSNNYLKSLVLDKATIEFNRDTTSYAVVVEYEVSKIKVTAEAEDEKSTVSGTGSFSLKVGVNTIKVNVKAENGETKTYILKITRQSKKPPVEVGNTYLSKLTIANHEINFDKNVLEYTIKIEDETELLLDYLPEDETSSVIVNGNTLLTSGSVIKILVTASDGTNREYKIIITKDLKEIITPEEPKEVVEKDDLGRLFLGLGAVLAIIIIFIIFIFTLIRRKKGKED